MQQVNFTDVSPEYEAFVQKFKPKKTTDDCYTPEPVYNAVADYVRKHYGLEGRRFVRPFYPGGDYERYPYAPGDVVVDNPPFSILTQIIQFYLANKILFFLFAPGNTIGVAKDAGVTYIGVGVNVTYENGAKVTTGFVTNLEPENAARSDCELYSIVNNAVPDNARKLSSYTYPANILTASMLNKFSQNGQVFAVRKCEAELIWAMEEQRKHKKKIFGGGFLISDSAARSKEAATNVVKEKEGLIVLNLSEREKQIVEGLNRKAKEASGA